MNKTVFRNRINSLVSFVSFTYNGKQCGVDPISHTHFEMWCGNEYLEAQSIDEVMNCRIFEGKSLNEIADKIDIIDW